MDDTGLRAIQAELRRFRDERGWRKYHTPKNLVLALCGEAGELAACYQWLTDETAWNVTEQIRDEMADVYIYLLNLADVLGVDLDAEALRKIEKNGEKHPAPVSGESESLS